MSMSPKAWAVSAFYFTGCALTFAATNDVIFHDVTFEAPTHVVDQLPTLDSNATDTVTSLLYNGTTDGPRIRTNSHSPQVLELLWTGGTNADPVVKLEQIRIVPPRPAVVQVGFDMLASTLNTNKPWEFAVLFDTSSDASSGSHANSFLFKSDGTFASTYDGGAGTPSQPGSFTAGTWHHVDVAIDLQLDQWTTTIDGEWICTLPTARDFVAAIRFSHRDWTGSGEDFVLVDNVTIASCPVFIRSMASSTGAVVLIYSYNLPFQTNTYLQMASFPQGEWTSSTSHLLGQAATNRHELTGSECLAPASYFRLLTGSE